ncbi:hypothetical protein BDP27DRAFT_1221108 [Rhodocollybia butyracea]|uniref:Tc1-like transposase DDE domain-containing protein n=1 Tax=Rhodocollybia butyracea TaxID=206335 RepID=A0A9P5PW28_9AGAR|nr:hypothetical protein BDP27DRAFT_1221108 [Rhodocollybia butyracea]
MFPLSFFYSANTHFIYTGCCVKYLSPYSRDFQPIELAFSAIKAHLRREGIASFTDDEKYYELY